MCAVYTRAGYSECDAGLNARAGERVPGPVQQVARIVAAVAMMAASVALVVATAAISRGRHGDVGARTKGSGR